MPSNLNCNTTRRLLRHVVQVTILSTITKMTIEYNNSVTTVLVQLFKRCHAAN